MEYRAGSGLCGAIERPLGDPVPWQEFVKPALRRTGDAVEDIGEPGQRIDVVELGGADERVYRRRAHAAAVGAGEEPLFAAQGNTPRALSRGGWPINHRGASRYWRRLGTAGTATTGAFSMGLARLAPLAIGAFLVSVGAAAERGRDGHVGIIYWQAPSILNPYLSGGTKDLEAASMVLEPLARFDESGNLTP